MAYETSGEDGDASIEVRQTLVRMAQWPMLRQVGKRHSGRARTRRLVGILFIHPEDVDGHRGLGLFILEYIFNLLNRELQGVT
jgi:hypothetical protein